MSKYLDLTGLTYFKSKLDTLLSGKQDTISDIDSIRTKANKVDDALFVGDIIESNVTINI